MQPAAPELVAGLCPADAEVEIYNEKENDVPLDRHWDLVFFSYLHPFYEHTKVLSTMFRRAGMTTVAGGRHASLYVQDCLEHFDSVVVGDPEPNVPQLVEDFQQGRLRKVYREPLTDPAQIRPYRYDLVDMRSNRFRGPCIEASRGCPFTCNFCVLTGHEKYRYRPVPQVVEDIRTRMRFNRHFFGAVDDTFLFYDNNLGGSPKYLRQLCEALIPLKKTWGCSLTMNVLEDPETIRLLGRAGCRYIYTGLESLSPESLGSLNKHQNHLTRLEQMIEKTYSNGILLSFGLMVGTDGDTNEYLQKVPDYLSDLKLFSITFLGIVCPYPGTPFFETVSREGRLLPGVTARDLDCYTVCHRPARLGPTEVVEHYRNLCRTLPRMGNLVKHCTSKLGMSRRPGYKVGILLSCPEIHSLKHNVGNLERRYIAGRDPVESWDSERMAELGLGAQRIS